MGLQKVMRETKKKVSKKFFRLYVDDFKANIFIVRKKWTSVLENFM